MTLWAIGCELRLVFSLTLTPTLPLPLPLPLTLTRCELWLVFFVLTFSLNFVPNIGM